MINGYRDMDLLLMQLDAVLIGDTETMRIMREGREYLKEVQ